LAVEYVRYKDIDKTKWDACIDNSVNILIYGKSFYLDNLAQNWDGIILNDYEAVMPLTWKKKWGISYLYQPSFIQQTGIFFTKKLTPVIFNAFFKLLETHFKFAEIALNYENSLILRNSSYNILERINYIIPLDKYNDGVAEFYHPHFTKSLRRIKKFNLRYEASVDFNFVISLYQQLYSSRVLSVTETEIKGLKKICRQLLKNNSLIIRQAVAPEGNVLAAALILKDAKRLYNIISCITPEGKKLEANYFLYDQVINEFAHDELILDMEGSDKKGIAAFYKKFNPETEVYYQLKINNLPALVKIFKP
jgi:hypothetical protein